jgi:hypothetical protein
MPLLRGIGRIVGLGGLGAVSVCAGYHASGAKFRFLDYDIPQKGSADAVKYTQKLEDKLQDLAIVKKLKDDPNCHMVKPWDYIHVDQKHRVFTTGSLHAPGAVSIPPVVFTNEKEKSTVTIVHCGLFLSGFPFLVHGGVLGTILDEALHRTASLSVGEYPREKVGIKFAYQRPTLVNQFFVVKTSTEIIESGKKARIVGSIRTLKDKELVRGEGVFDVSGSYTWKSMVGL